MHELSIGFINRQGYRLALLAFLSPDIRGFPERGKLHKSEWVFFDSIIRHAEHQVVSSNPAWLRLPLYLSWNSFDGDVRKLVETRRQAANAREKSS